MCLRFEVVNSPGCLVAAVLDSTIPPVTQCSVGRFPLNTRDTQPPARRPEGLGNLIAYIPCALVLGKGKTLHGNFLELGVESYHMF